MAKSMPVLGLSLRLSFDHESDDEVEARTMLSSGALATGTSDTFEGDHADLLGMLDFPDMPIDRLQQETKPQEEIHSEWEHLQDVSESMESELRSYKPPSDISASHNRYTDILPLRSTRVSLSKPPCPSTNPDYINANMIQLDLGGCSTKYISAQAPLASSIGEFWTMVYEHRIHLIVMLTKLTEMKKEKCSRYWPQNTDEGLRFDNGLHVTLRDEKTSIGADKSIAIRRMYISMQSSPNKDFEVTQIDYAGWPDFGVPLEYSSYQDLFQMYNIHRGIIPPDDAERPILVHCSAGIGRTGTFIAIDYLLSRIEHLRGMKGYDDAHVSVPGIVYEIRKCRSRMVQTLLQYEFIYGFLEYCAREELFGFKKKPQLLMQTSSYAFKRKTLRQNMTESAVPAPIVKRRNSMTKEPVSKAKDFKSTLSQQLS